MTEPKVTVLMSVFDGLPYLPASIESILSQSFGDFEFLIIDDGSTEPVMDVIGSYKDPRIRLAVQENRGLTRSLNRGLGMARGTYIARMDADDLSLPGRLEAQVTEMESDCRLDLVGSFFDVIDGRGEVIERKELILDPIYRLWRLQFHNNYGHGTMMLRKEAVLAAGLYDETLAYSQDFDLWSRMSGKDNTGIIDKVLYRYRMVESGGQSSVRNYDRQLAAAIGTSNRSLQACNPSLAEDDCAEVRALYGKFQRDRVSCHGLSLVPQTLKGFCRLYSLTPQEMQQLASRVAEDVLVEIDRSAHIEHHDRQYLREPWLDPVAWSRGRFAP